MLYKNVNGVRIAMSTAEEAAFIAAQIGTIESQRGKAHRKLKTLREVKFSSGVSYNGKTFNADLKTIARLQLANQFNENSIDWVTADGTNISLSKIDREAIMLAIYELFEASFVTFIAFEAQIESSEDPASILIQF